MKSQAVIDELNKQRLIQDQVQFNQMTDFSYQKRAYIDRVCKKTN